MSSKLFIGCVPPRSGGAIWWMLMRQWPGLPDRIVSSLASYAFGCCPHAKPGCCCPAWQVVLRLSVIIKRIIIIYYTKLKPNNLLVSNNANASLAAETNASTASCRWLFVWLRVPSPSYTSKTRCYNFCDNVSHILTCKMQQSCFWFSPNPAPRLSRWVKEESFSGILCDYLSTKEVMFEPALVCLSVCLSSVRLSVSNFI